MAMQEKKTENVLIVDDVVANLVVLTDIIKKAGYIARPVTSVKQAKDAILLDTSDLDIDGVIREMKRIIGEKIAL